MYKMHMRWVVYALCGCFLGCESADTASTMSLKTFKVEECTGPDEKLPLAMGLSLSDYRGLTCVMWNFRDGIKVAYINRETGCGFGGLEDETLWGGRAVKKRDKLSFLAEWQADDVNACGDCRDSFFFESEYDVSDEEVQLEVGVRSCTEGCPWEKESQELSVKDNAEGVSCRYTNLDRIHLADSEYGGVNSPPDDGRCKSGTHLVFIDARDLCVRDCAGDSDCVPENIYVCKDHGCVVRQ
jgi:hypothetical protein